MPESHDAVVIGGGQAGLAMSYQLRQRGREHIILERGRIAERWRSERWQSLRFQFPNWTIRLPGMDYGGKDDDSFAHYSDIARFISDYAKRIEAPIREGTEALSLRCNSSSDRFHIETTHGAISARHVIVATGPFQRPRIPAFADDLPTSIYQTDATRYSSPEDLPGGAVLVVGSGASGCQIADELCHAGRKVFLSVSRHRRVPRRYREKDMFWWFEKLGRFDVTIDSFPNRRYPPSTVVTGANGGYDVDIRRSAREGVQVLGHALGVSGSTLGLASDAEAILRDADQAYRDFIAAADAWLSQSELRGSLPEDGRADVATSAELRAPTTLDLNVASIGTVIWATGYRHDFDWVHLPVFDETGAPFQNRGVTGCPGLYFLGLHWMHTFKSGLLSFVGDDAAYLADDMDRSDAS